MTEYYVNMKCFAPRMQSPVSPAKAVTIEMHCDFATVQGKTGKAQVNYHNSFTAWPRDKFTFNFSMQSCKIFNSDEAVN